MKVLALLLVASCMLAGVSATSTCRSFLPGDQGVMTKFFSRSGTETNITFYTFDQPVLGGNFKIIAGKGLPSGDVLPVENLTIIMRSNGIEVARDATDYHGAAHFTFESPGVFEFTGGDANLTVTIAGGSGAFNDTIASPPFNCSVNSTGGSAALPGNSTDGEAALPDEGEPAPKASKKASENLPIYIFIIPAAIIVAAVFVVLKRRGAKKGGLKKKGLAH